MIFDKRPVAGKTRPQIMRAMDTIAGQDSRLNPLPILIRKLSIKKLREGVLGDAVSVPEHVAGDREREGGISTRPASQFSHAESYEHGNVDGNVGQVVRSISSNGC